MTIQYLPWDSELFGYRVGKLNLHTLPGHDVLQLYRRAALDFRVVYVYSNYSLPLEESCIDIKVVFRKNIGPTKKTATGTTKLKEYKGKPNRQLYNLALESGTYSRFNTDERFRNGEFEKLYRVWLERSVNREIADTVFVVLQEKRIAGFITIERDREVGKIGLIAVSAGYRGNGIGKLLLKHAEWYSAQKNLQHLEVATQACNQKAVHFYKAAGYIIAGTTKIYHWWNE